jgi:hypothetical protein
MATTPAPSRTYTVQQRYLPRSHRRASLSSRGLSSLSHQDAIEKLNTLQSNAVALEAMRKSGQGPKAEFAITEMIEYLDRIGYSVCTAPPPRTDV